MDDGKLEALGQKIVGALPGAASAHSVAFNQLTVTVEASKVVDVVKFLRDDPGCRFVNFTDVTAVDTARYSEVFARCYVATDAHAVDPAVLADTLAELNALPGTPGYFTETFCEQSRFFQPFNGERVDAIRAAIARDHQDTALEPLLLTSLLEAADRVRQRAAELTWEACALANFRVLADDAAALAAVHGARRKLPKHPRGQAAGAPRAAGGSR